MVKRRRRQRAERSWINIGYVESEESVDNVGAENVEEFVDFNDIRPSAKEDTDISIPDLDKEGPKKQASGADTKVFNSLPLDARDHTERGTGLAGVGDFDLEMWWRKSPKLARLNVFIIMLLLILALAHTIIGITFIIQSFFQEKVSPYVCKTEECQRAAVYMTYPMNFSVDPCDNFYEFMCGKYEEPMTQGPYFADFLENPGFKLELGEDSILSEILRDFHHDDSYDQSIRYYQSCLNEANKKTRQAEALIEKIKSIFGTDDFSTLEASTGPPLERIAARIMRTVGHSYYINFAFAAYPYIQLLTPSYIMYINNSPHNRIYVEHIFRFLNQKRLGISKELIPELVNGVTYWTELSLLFLAKTTFLNNSVVGDENKFHSVLKDEIPAYFCPPMGIRLDVVEVFSNFLKVRWSEEYFDSSAKKHWVALRWCFDRPATNFEFSKHNISANHKRLAFVSIWLFGLVQEMIPVMYKDFIFEIIPRSIVMNLSFSDLVSQALSSKVSTIEDKCMEELWLTLGYMSSVRYLTSNFDDPESLLIDTRKEILELYRQTRDLFWKIPREEIHRFTERQGRLILGRDLHVDLVMPLKGGSFDKYQDILKFSADDHLKNHFTALALTIESGRMFWLSSTDPISVPKWWGVGGLQSMRDQLFELRFPFISPARFEEEDGAFTQGRWRKSLGRKPFNYILFSLALLTEPHIKETLALKMAGSSLKVIRAHLALVAMTARKITYPYYNARRNASIWRAKMRNDDGNDYDPKYPNATNTCYALKPNPDFNYDDIYDYAMEETNAHEISSNDNFYRSTIFYNTMALKIAFKIFKTRQKEINAAPYKSLDTSGRRLRIQRRLPDPLEDYNEDQLFFMAYVRHLCRLSWKKDEDDEFNYRTTRYLFETDILNTLMQTDEFHKTWKCKKDSLMNNLGRPKCFKWIP